MHLRQAWCSSIPVRASQPRLVPFCFILHSSITFSVLLCSTQVLPILHTSFLGSCSPFSPDYIILSFKSNFDSQQANISLHLCSISHIEPKDIGIQCHQLPRYNVLANRRCATSFFALFMNCVFMQLSVLV